MNILVSLCLFYIKGLPDPTTEFTILFKNGNESINSSASEFLELLVTFIDKRLVGQEVIYMIINPILLVTQHAISKKDFVTLIQMINLLRTIFKQAAFRNETILEKDLLEKTNEEKEEIKNEMKKKRKEIIELLCSDFFIPNLLVGLYLPFTYVRILIIDFFTFCIPILSEFLNNKELSSCIGKIFEGYYYVIRFLFNYFLLLKLNFIQISI